MNEQLNSASSCCLIEAICDIAKIENKEEHLNAIGELKHNYLSVVEKYQDKLSNSNIICPLIVEALNNDSSKDKLAEGYFINYIRIITIYVQGKAYKEAADLYMDMINWFRVIYMINVSNVKDGEKKQYIKKTTI